MKRRPRLKAPVALGSILQGEAGRRSLRLIDLYRAQKHWGEIVGGMMAERTYPKRIRGETLYVAVENAGWAQHLTMMKDQVIEALSERAELRFADLRFVNEPLPRIEKKEWVASKEPEPPLEAKPEPNIADKDLSDILGRVRARLERLQAHHAEKKRR